MSSYFQRLAWQTEGLHSTRTDDERTEKYVNHKNANNHRVVMESSTKEKFQIQLLLSSTQTLTDVQLWKEMEFLPRNAL